MSTRDNTESVDPGDDRGILRAYLHWSPTVPPVLAAKPGGPGLGCIVRRPDGVVELAFSLDRNARRCVYFAVVGEGDGSWPIVQLGPNTWDLPVSIHIPGQFHGFVTLVNVPCLPPWSAVSFDEAREGRDGGER